MNQPNEETCTVTATPIPEEERLAFIEKTFGLHFPLAIEPAIYSITEKMAKEYHGGLWYFCELAKSNWPSPGFFMYPDSDQIYSVNSANGSHGKLSSQALGIVVCQTVFSHLSFSKREDLARLCARHYYLLREFSFSQSEIDVMLRILD